jgi:hypothetical protein
MRSLTRNALIVASLVLTGNAAIAAPAHKVVSSHAVHSRVVARAPAQDQQTFGLFDFLFGGPSHYAQVGGQTRGRVDTSSSSPSYDTSPPIDYGSQSQDSTNETLMENSMRATQEANDEANAAVTAGILAAQQTEIYANSYANNPN